RRGPLPVLVRPYPRAHAARLHPLLGRADPVQAPAAGAAWNLPPGVLVRLRGHRASPPAGEGRPAGALPVERGALGEPAHDIRRFLPSLRAPGRGPGGIQPAAPRPACDKVLPHGGRGGALASGEPHARGASGAGARARGGAGRAAGRRGGDPRRAASALPLRVRRLHPERHRLGEVSMRFLLVLSALAMCHRDDEPPRAAAPAPAPAPAADAPPPIAKEDLQKAEAAMTEATQLMSEQNLDAAKN